MTTFEQELAERLQREVSGSGGAFDAGRIAREAMARRTLRDRAQNRLGLGDALPLTHATRRLVVALVAAALVVVTLALAASFAHLGGTRLVLIRTNGDVVIADADGSAQQVIARVSAFSPFFQVAVAPDGAHVAYLDDYWQLTVVDLFGTVTFQRTLDQGWSHFAWSPDGGRLAILDGALLPREPTDQTTGPPIVKPHLDIVRVDGTPDGTVTLPDALRYVLANGAVAWAPDGRALAITGFVRGQPILFPSSIWLVDLRSGSVREMESSARTSDFYPRWLPNGRIVFSREDSGIWQVDPATGVETLVFAPPKPWKASMIITNLEPSPDGSRLVFIAPNVGLGVLDLSTNALLTPALPRGGGSPPVQWSADGRSLVTRWSATVDAKPFYPTSVAQVDLTSNELTVLADDVMAFDVRH